MDLEEKKQSCPPKALTLIELTIAVLIIGILTGITIKGFQRAIDNARQKDAVMNLLTIKAAERLYCQKNGACYPPSGIALIGAINQYLNLSIVQPADFTYRCQAEASPAFFKCQAIYTSGGNGWTYTIYGNTEVPTCTPQGTGTCL